MPFGKRVDTFPRGGGYLMLDWYNNFSMPVLYYGYRKWAGDEEELYS